MSPVQPQFRAVPMTSFARLAAPRDGGGVPAAQPRRADDRRGQRGADHPGQRVQSPDQQRFPLDLGVPELRALLLVAGDAFLRGVDVDEGEGLRAGQQRRLPREVRQELPVGLVQLADVSPGEGAQERAERGRGADPAEQPVHRAVPQQAHVVDRVGARGHAGRQAGDLQARVRAAVAVRADVRRGQVVQPGTLGEGGQRDQAGVRHQVRVVKRRARFRERMQQSHLRGVLSDG